MMNNQIFADKPGPIDPPISCPETTKDSITLNWTPPKDDGQSEIIGYNIERRDLTRQAWVRVGKLHPNLEFVCNKLSEGSKYVFRVSAENQFGEGPATESEPIEAKNMFDVPEAPGKPKIASVDTKELTLTWDKPKRDGGRPIDGYILERFDPETERWSKVTPKVIKEETFTVTDMRPYKSCKFRVSAVNEAGTGKPSNGSDDCELNCKFLMLLSCV